MAPLTIWFQLTNFAFADNLFEIHALIMFLVGGGFCVLCLELFISIQKACPEDTFSYRY
jgi:hypothetical protein